MPHLILPSLLCFSSFLFSACDTPEKWQKTGATVEIVREGERFQLLRHGKPYFIKGSGAYSNFEMLAEAGGNSIRIWDTNDATRILDQAHALGLSVNLGIWLTREKEGFNYDDKRAVEKQFEHAKRQVLKYKDHPALLMWSIGNEMNKNSRNIRVWDAINEIAAMIHRLDPNHPVTTAIMGSKFRTIKIITERCPELDLLSFNVYGTLPELAEDMEKSTWDGPYIVSEYGSLGYWEVDHTSWGSPIEPSSSQKADQIETMYKEHIRGNSEKCLGAYAFYWGNKHEKTHTWFSFFSSKGEKTEPVDILNYLWKGDLPKNQAPKIEELKLGARLDKENLFVSRDSVYSAKIIASDPENDSLQYTWEILPEIEIDDGAVERVAKPRPIDQSIVSAKGPLVHWKAPPQAGAYRLYVKVTDNHNNMATANLPFFVEDEADTALPAKEARVESYVRSLSESLFVQ
ncbi:MAG: glycoside hydrolase family 2 TIM barrel-domain containing protein [Cyclobacteriaceae bacterium]